MKKFFYGCFALFFLFTSFSICNDYGVNLGFVAQPTKFDSKFSFVTGVKLGMNFSKNYYAGLALYGMTLFKNNVNATETVNNVIPVLEMNYYGVETEYFLYPENTFHISFGLLAGVADVFLNIPHVTDESGKIIKPSFQNGVNKFILNPSVNLNLNLKSFYRIAVGVSYRYIQNFEYSVPNVVNPGTNSAFILNSSLINGPALNFSIKFGSF